MVQKFVDCWSHLVPRVERRQAGFSFECVLLKFIRINFIFAAENLKYHMKPLYETQVEARDRGAHLSIFKEFTRRRLVEAKSSFDATSARVDRHNSDSRV